MQFVSKIFLIMLILLFIVHEASLASSEKFENFKKEIISYFPVLSGNAEELEKGVLLLNKGFKDGLKKGQRVVLYEETVPLLHPVTKQIIGKSEKIIGYAEIIEANETFSKALILDDKFKLEKKNFFFKIPKSKIKLLYAQTNTEWAVGEAYYRDLKDTERFELIDAPVNVEDKEILFKYAPDADILLLLKPFKLNGNLKLYQELYWIKDKKLLSTSEILLTEAALSELRKKYASLIVPEGHTLLSYRLSRSINRVSSGNFDGVSKNQIIIASDKEISLYTIDVDLKLKSNYVIPIGGEIIWFDTGDIDRDGIDEIIISLKRENTVISMIIKWTDNAFSEISRLENLFLRVYNGRLLAQSFSQSYGFEGEMFFIQPLKFTYEKIETLKLPIRSNIYDFYIFGNLIFKWEEDGFFAVYNEKGIPLWRSEESLGYGLQYEKQTGVAMLSLGKWNIHSRIKPLRNGVIVIEKKPLLGFVNLSTLGYRSSKLKLLQWTGIGIEEVEITEEMSGEILDYSVSSDRLFVLVKPPFGFNPKRLLQGENPFETILHILSLRY